MKNMYHFSINFAVMLSRSINYNNYDCYLYYINYVILL